MAMMTSSGGFKQLFRALSGDVPLTHTPKKGVPPSQKNTANPQSGFWILGGLSTAAAALPYIAKQLTASLTATEMDFCLSRWKIWTQNSDKLNKTRLDSNRWKTEFRTQNPRGCGMRVKST
jgi:hypothetical protein